MEVNENRTLLTKFNCRMTLWMLILVLALEIPDGVLASHRSSIDERTAGISARDSLTNTRMSSRNTRNRSGIQTSASPSRVSNQRESTRPSDRCGLGRTCDPSQSQTNSRSSVRTQSRGVAISQPQSQTNSRSSVRTQGRVVSTAQGTRRRGSTRTASSSVPSRARVPSRAGVSTRTRAPSPSRATPRDSVLPRNVAISRANEPSRTAVSVQDRTTSRGSISTRGSVSNVPSRVNAPLRAGVAVRSSGSSRASVPARSRVPSRVSSRTDGSSRAGVSTRNEQSRAAGSTRSGTRSSPSSGVAVRNSLSSSRTPSRGSSRAISRGTQRGSSRGSSSPVGTSTRNSSRGTSRVASRGSSVGVNRASSRSNSRQTSTRGDTGQRARSSRGQQTRTASSTTRVRAVPTAESRGRANRRSGSANTGTGPLGNSALPPSVNRFLNELKSSMPGAIGVGLGMSMANGPSDTRQPSSSRSTSSSSSTSGGGRRIAVNQRQTGSSARGLSPDHRLGSRAGSQQRVVSVNRVQPIIRPTFETNGVGLDNQQLAVHDNILHTDPFISNDFPISPQGSSFSGNGNNFVDSQRGSGVGISDGFLHNSLDRALPVSNMNRGIIPNLDQFVPQQQNQFNQDNIIPQTGIQNNQFTLGQTQNDPIIQGSNQLDTFSQGQVVGVHDTFTSGRTAGGATSNQIQANDPRIVMDMQGIQTQVRPAEPLVGIRQNVINTGLEQSQTLGQTQGQPVAIDPIIRDNQFIQGNTVGNVFGRVNVQSQGHSPIQQVQRQPIQHQDALLQSQIQSQIQQNLLPGHQSQDALLQSQIQGQIQQNLLPGQQSQDALLVSQIQGQSQQNLLPGQQSQDSLLQSQLQGQMQQNLLPGQQSQDALLQSQIQGRIQQNQLPIQHAQIQHQINQLPVQQGQIIGAHSHAGTQSQIPINDPTFIKSNTQGIIRPLIGSNAMEIPQQGVNSVAGIPLQDASQIGTVNIQPTSQSNAMPISNTQGGIVQPAGTTGGIALQSWNSPQARQPQNTGVNSAIQNNGQLQQPIGVNSQQQGLQSMTAGLQQQPVGVSQIQTLDPVQSVNQNQFSTNINDLQQSFPIPNAPVQDQGHVQSQGQNQIVQDQMMLSSLNSAGQFVTPQPLDQTHLKVNRFQNSNIQMSGVIHRNQNDNQLLSSQLIGGQGQTAINSNTGGIGVHHQISHAAQQEVNALGGQTLVHSSPIRPLDQQQLNILGGGGSATFTQPLHQTGNQVNQQLNTPLAAGGSIAQPLSQTANQHQVNTNQNQSPINAIAGHVLNRLQHAQTISQIHEILTGQQSNAAVASNPSPTGSIGTIGGQTFQGISPAAPAQGPLLNPMISPTNGAFDSTTPNPKRMLIQIDPNSKGVKIVPDGMGGVRVISLREAVTVSPFGNDNQTGLMASLNTTQSAPYHMSVPIGSSIISQTVILSNKTSRTNNPARFEMEKEINTGITDIPEELEINGTSPDGTPPNAGLDAGASPTPPTEPTSAALLRVTEATIFTAEVPTTPQTPAANVGVTDVIVSAEVPTTVKKLSNDDGEDEDNNTSTFIETIHIIDPFYGGMHRELVRNTNIIQDLINRLAAIEYEKNRHAINKATKEQPAAGMMMHSVLRELVKLENTRAKEATTFHHFVSRRSTAGTTRRAGVTHSSPRATTPTPVVTTSSTVNNGTIVTMNNSTTNKPLSIEDIHAFLHTFPNSKDILKRLGDIFANNKSTTVPAISKLTQQTTPTIKSGLQTSGNLSSSTTKPTTAGSVTQTRGVTRPTTTRVTTDSRVPGETSSNGLPAGIALTSVNGDISFGDASARRLNKLRIPVDAYNGKTRTLQNNQGNRLLKTTRKSKPFSTTERTVKVAGANSAVFSLKKGNRNSNVAIYGTNVGSSREQHHVKGHNRVNTIKPRQIRYKAETTIRFRPTVTTRKTTQRQGSRYAVTTRPGGIVRTPTTAVFSMAGPTTAKQVPNSYRGEHFAGGALSKMPSFMPLLGEDIIAALDNKSTANDGTNKRIEPNLSTILSNALKIQSPNGMQIKQLPRSKRTSSGLHTIS